MDGGTIYNVDVESAINQCREVVDDDADIIVDIAICDNYYLATKSKPARTALFEFFRGHTIHSYYTSSDLIADAKRAHPDVNWRSVFYEREGKLSGAQELDFRNSTTWPAQEQGRKDAKNFLEA
jgi:hypothetical protein